VPASFRGTTWGCWGELARVCAFLCWHDCSCITFAVIRERVGITFAVEPAERVTELLAGAARYDRARERDSRIDERSWQGKLGTGRVTGECEGAGSAEAKRAGCVRRWCQPRNDDGAAATATAERRENGLRSTKRSPQPPLRSSWSGRRIGRGSCVALLADPPRKRAVIGGRCRDPCLVFIDGDPECDRDVLLRRGHCMACVSHHLSPLDHEGGSCVARVWGTVAEMVHAGVILPGHPRAWGRPAPCARAG